MQYFFLLYELKFTESISSEKLLNIEDMTKRPLWYLCVRGCASGTWSPWWRRLLLKDLKVNPPQKIGLPMTLFHQDQYYQAVPSDAIWDSVPGIEVIYCWSCSQLFTLILHSLICRYVAVVIPDLIHAETKRSISLPINLLKSCCSVPQQWVVSIRK